MGIFDFIKQKRAQPRSVAGMWLQTGAGDCPTGYVRLDRCPEIVAGCIRIAELIGSMTIHLMANRDNGDVRIQNELSRAIDINPMPNMTRSAWMQAIVMNLLLYGDGNSVVIPHTYEGYLRSLEPVAADRVIFNPVPGSRRDYTISIDGRSRDPGSLIHIVYHPDSYYLWKGQGLRVTLREIAANLGQAQKTIGGFMSSEYKPSLVVLVDSMTEELASEEGRQKILDDYVKRGRAGEPWIIPAEQFKVEQVKPLSLSDLAIADTVDIDKKTVAAVLGIPPFVLGVGEYDRDAWNSFIQNTIRPIALNIQQELTKKLIVSPNMYLRFNVRSLMEYNLATTYQVFAGLRSSGVVSGNEVRDAIGLSPLPGLDELLVLENYIPADLTGEQSKLKGD